MAIPLPPDICGIFCRVSKISLPKATSGNMPGAAFAGVCPLPAFLPQPSPLRVHLSPPPRGHTASPPLCSPLSTGGSLGAAWGGCNQVTHLAELVLVQEPGVGVRPCFSAAARGARGKSCFLLDLVTNKQLWCLGR